MKKAINNTLNKTKAYLIRLVLMTSVGYVHYSHANMLLA